MEQARYWMWTNRKHDFGSHVFAPQNPSFGDSWEEQAFAEDAAGALGGCVWPPRSYSCSFCRREFKSAQALGGHMNVHRRDRARLKQSPAPHTDVLPHTHILNPGASLDVQNSPPQICSNFLCNLTSNSDHQGVFTSSSTSARVSSSPPTKIDLKEKLPNPPFVSSILSENHPKSNMSSPQAWSNLVADKYFHVSGLTNGDESFKTSKSNGRANDEYVKEDLSVSLNLLPCRTHSSVSSDAEKFPSCNKRRRIDHETSSNAFLSKPKSSQVERCKIPQSDVPKLSPNSIGDLDLELRLGDPPKKIKGGKIVRFIESIALDNHIDLLKEKIKHWEGHHIPRDMNSVADRLAKSRVSRVQKLLAIIEQ